MFPKMLIAGPCAAESEEQVTEVAQALAPLRPIFRAGIWKPRTQPDTFQGAGERALVWLQKVQCEYHLPVATEAGTPQQVLAAAKAGIDYLWIGARTAANPIAVQALADAVKACVQDGCRLQGLLIKNPVHDDAALWAGNILRLQAVGLPVIAVHRGCNHRPCWQTAYGIRCRMPDIPLLMDPSHMSGNADKVAELCRTAVELDYDGLMVEVHSHPDRALSDARQQITPQQLYALIDSPAGTLTDERELRWLRKMIDEADDELWQAVAARMAVSRRIGDYKRKQQMPVLQPDRFNQILQKRLQWAEAHGLSPDAVQTIMEQIHKESVRVQL